MPYLTTTKFVDMPLSLDQLAIALSRLPKAEIENLFEMSLDRDLEKKILQRGANAWQEHNKGNTLSLKALQKEF